MRLHPSCTEIFYFRQNNLLRSVAASLIYIVNQDLIAAGVYSLKHPTPAIFLLILLPAPFCANYSEIYFQNIFVSSNLLFKHSVPGIQQVETGKTFQLPVTP